MTATAQLFTDAGPVHVTEALARGFKDKVEAGWGTRSIRTTGSAGCSR